MNKRRIRVDFDGTLVKLLGDELDYTNVTPIQPMIDWVNAQHDAGHEIIISSGRGFSAWHEAAIRIIDGSEWATDYIAAYLEVRKLTMDQISEFGVKFSRVYIGTHTIPADVCLDDRFMAFDILTKNS